jgi:hypothetical protein
MIEGSYRVLRGGSWINNGRNTRSANRNRNEPANRNDNIGFRLALARTTIDAPFDQIVIRSARCWRQKLQPFGARVDACSKARRSGAFNVPVLLL